MECNFNKRWILLISLFSLITIAPLHAQLRVAVGNFENQTSLILLDAWARNLPDYLSSELSHSSNIVLVERNQLKEIFKELHLALQGFVQDSAAVEQIGKLAGADVLISGVITKIERRYVILAHITRVKNGEVFVERVEAPDRKHFKEMVQLLANNINFRLTDEGTYQARKAIKKYPTFYFFSAGVLSTATALVLHNKYTHAYHHYEEVTQLDRLDAEYNKANRDYKWSNLFWTAAGAGFSGAIFCWIRNWSHADITAGSGGKPSLSVRPYLIKSGRGVHVGLAFHF